MKKPKPILFFACLLLLALGCKAVFVIAPAKQKTVDVKINTKDASRTQKDTTRTQKGTTRTQTGATHTQINIEQ